MKRRFGSTVCLTCLILIVGAAPVSASLVTNGSFEGGNVGFSDTIPGWNVEGPTGYTGGQCGSGYYIPHTGSCAAIFGGSSLSTTISQTLSTSPGAQYQLTFYLWVDSGAPPSELQVSWAGSVVFDQLNLPQQNYTLMSLNVTATGTSTVLQFAGIYPNSNFLVDDVDVVNAVPEPATWVSSGLALACLVLKNCRRSRR